jgi:TetR/AcrR family fatty acid metabolism transcriptional regulator
MIQEGYMEPVTKTTGEKARKGNKRPAIINAARQVFGEKGFHSATISEIARKAKVSEATVYEYYGSKEDLLFAIPEEITRSSVEFLEAVLPFVKGAENRLRAVIYGYFIVYRDNPDYSALVLLDLKHNRKFMQTEGYHMVRRAAGLLKGVIEEGIESGEFRDDLDPSLVRAMVLGTIEHIFFRWHLLERKEELPEFVDDLIMAGIGVREVPSFNINVSTGKSESVSSGAQTNVDTVR